MRRADRVEMGGVLGWMLGAVALWLPGVWLSLDVAAQCQREPLGPTLTPVVHVSDVASLLAAFRQANKTRNLTIALAEGEYALKRPFGLSNRNITLCG